uniref:Protein Dr1 n=1 Tax=Meloidogyne incognita TaxID=6306 RepID=A0A914LNY4_MELIC
MPFIFLNFSIVLSVVSCARISWISLAAEKMADEEAEGVGLPQKGLNMIIKDALPDMRIANETREVLNQCCVEFIKHISKEAQMISSKDQRKTIYHDHVQKALKNLGFPREYVDAANSVLGECKIAAEKRLKRKNSRLDKCGIPEEQLFEMQQRLIEQVGGFNKKEK